MKKKIKCEWAGSEKMIAYHDTDWGVPIHNDKKLFEMLVLEGAQAGLSWATILSRRKNYKKAFDNYNIKKIAGYGKKEVNRLVSDAGIIRNRLKIQSVISNARLFVAVQKEFGSFDQYIWGFVNYKPIKNKRKKMGEIPATTQESDAMSKDLKKRGFKFVGSTICYAYMQSVGMVNDHRVDCFRYKEV
jgi:DNA-3-methyladenine glycosylase I